MNIQTFTLNGVDVEMTYRNGFLAYTFQLNGNPYGNKVKLASKKIGDVSAASFLLFENALSTIKSLKNEN